MHYPDAPAPKAKPTFLEAVARPLADGGGIDLRVRVDTATERFEVRAYFKDAFELDLSAGDDLDYIARHLGHEPGQPGAWARLNAQLGEAFVQSKAFARLPRLNP